MIGKSMARGDDESTPSAGAEAEGRSVGTRGWFIISECHWLTIIGELRSLWFAIIYCFCNPKSKKHKNNFLALWILLGMCNIRRFKWIVKKAETWKLDDNRKVLGCSYNLMVLVSLSGPHRVTLEDGATNGEEQVTISLPFYCCQIYQNCAKFINCA